jgi:Transposase IS116/IS110/IS902 family
VDGSLWPGGLGLAPGRSAIARGTAAVDSEMILLEAVRARVRQSDRLVRRLGSGDERVRWVRSIPGIGPFFAVRIVNEIGDVTRFARPANLCGYAGLVPAVYASGGRVFHGRLTKQGNRWLRWALVESRAPRSEDGSGAARRLRAAPAPKGAEPGQDRNGTSVTDHRASGAEPSAAAGAPRMEGDPRDRSRTRSVGQRTENIRAKDLATAFIEALRGRVEEAQAMRAGVSPATGRRYPLTMICAVFRVPRSSVYAATTLRPAAAGPAADGSCVASMTSLTPGGGMNELSDGMIRPFNATREGRHGSISEIPVAT